MGHNSIFDGRDLTDKIASKAVKINVCATSTVGRNAMGVGLRVKHARNATLSCSVSLSISV